MEDNAGLEAESDRRLISAGYMGRTIAGEACKELECVWSAGIRISNMLGNVASTMNDGNEQITVWHNGFTNYCTNFRCARFEGFVGD